MDTETRWELTAIRDRLTVLLEGDAPSDTLPVGIIEAKPSRLPPWYILAQQEVGTREIRGKKHNDRILEYHASTGLSADDDETPWCSSFVNWCFEQVGMKGTNSARARSWEDWGVPLDEPVIGCVCVYWRGTPTSGKGHVNFFTGMEDAEILGLGGNQANMVNIRGYDQERLLGYRWPG